MMKVLSVDGKWTKLERTRQRRINRYWRKFIISMTVFGVGLAWLINS